MYGMQQVINFHLNKRKKMVGELQKNRKRTATLMLVFRKLKGEFSPAKHSIYRNAQRKNNNKLIFYSYRTAAKTKNNNKNVHRKKHFFSDFSFLRVSIELDSTREENHLWSLPLHSAGTLRIMDRWIMEIRLGLSVGIQQRAPFRIMYYRFTFILCRSIGSRDSGTKNNENATTTSPSVQRCFCRDACSTANGIRDWCIRHALNIQNYSQIELFAWARTPPQPFACKILRIKRIFFAQHECDDVKRR